MKTKHVFFSALLMLFTTLAQAQQNDAQLWENVNIEKNITPKLVARVNQEGRFTDNIRSFTFNYFDFGLNYKFNKHIHATLAYVWVEKQTKEGFWTTRHQAYADVTLRQKMGAFLLSDRQMFLWQVKDVRTSATGRYPEFYLRNKATIRWDKTFRVQPYVACEIYYHLNRIDANDFVFHYNRVRYFAGVFYHPDKSNEFEAYYLLEHHFNESNPTTNWVIGLGYDHSF
ncbi:MAG: DUF2490 domain-containing protein [Bacteroidia bacterium]